MTPSKKTISKNGRAYSADLEPIDDGATLEDELGQFASIPFDFIDDCVDVPDTSRWLFVVLRRFTNHERGHPDKGKAFPSYNAIHAVTGWNHTTISKAIKGLLKSRWMKKETQPGYATRYKLVRPKESTTETVDPALPSEGTTVSVEGVYRNGRGGLPKRYQKYINEIDKENTEISELRSEIRANARDAGNSSENEEIQASDNAMFSGGPISACGLVTESEELEARLISEYRNTRGAGDPPGTGIFSCFIRPMSATEFSAGSEYSEIGDLSEAKAPPPVPLAPPAEKSSHGQARRQSVPFLKREASEATRKIKPKRQRTGQRQRIVIEGITSDHPAVVAIWHLTGKRPHHETWPGIVSAMGESWDQKRLTETYRAWIATGYNPFNLSGWLFNWYVNGIPDRSFGSRDPEPAPPPKPPRTYCGKCADGWIFNGERGKGVHRCRCNPPDPNRNKSTAPPPTRSP